MIVQDRLRPADIWYVVVYIVTDVNLSKDGRYINITSKDRQHLFEIQKRLGISNKIGWKARGGSTEKIYSQIQFSDVRFYRYLLGLGIHPRKSLTLKEILIDKAYFSDFLRGIIDGDGNIHTWIHPTNAHRQWALRIVSASPIFASWLKNEIETYFGVRGRLYAYKHSGKKNFINILKFGKLATKVILQNTYYSDAFALKRKIKTANVCLQDQNKMINYGNVISSGAVTGSQNRLKID